MKAAGLILAMVTLIGLSVGCDIMDTISAVESRANGYFEARRTANYDRAVTYYSPNFFRADPATSPDDERERLERVESRLGALQAYRFLGLEAEAYWGNERPSGTYYLVKYEVTYARYTAIETMTLFRPHDTADGELKILAYEITVQGLP